LSFPKQETLNEPEQLVVKSLTVPQVAVALISLYVPLAGLLQFGAFADQIIFVGTLPLLQVKAGGVIAAPEIPLVGTEPQVSVAGLTINEPLQLAVKPLTVPQVAVALILLYMPFARLLQFGAFADQVILVGGLPLLQVKAGGVIVPPEIPLVGTEPQVSVAGLTVNEPLQLTVKPLSVPQVAVALILLYVPTAGLFQFGASADQVTLVGDFPLLQVKVGVYIAEPEIPLFGTEPQVSVIGLTVNVPLQLAVLVAKPQFAVTLILPYVPLAGLLQFGAFVQVGVPRVPRLQVKSGGFISMPSYLEACTEPQVSVTGLTVKVPQETAGKVPCPQFASASTA